MNRYVKLDDMFSIVEKSKHEWIDESWWIDYEDFKALLDELPKMEYGLSNRDKLMQLTDECPICHKKDAIEVCSTDERYFSEEKHNPNYAIYLECKRCKRLVPLSDEILDYANEQFERLYGKNK